MDFTSYSAHVDGVVDALGALLLYSRNLIFGEVSLRPRLRITFPVVDKSLSPFSPRAAPHFYTSPIK